MTACPVCDGDADPTFNAWDENHRVSKMVFRYLRCRQCGTIFIAHPPEDLGSFYEAEYYAIPTLDRIAAIARKDRNKINIVDRFARGKRLVEIGPAFGVFAWQAKQSGYDVHTIEMDERCCAFLRDEIGVGVTNSIAPHRALESLPPQDVIALWHVLEHLPDVGALVKAAARNLKPSGVLIVAMPNPDAAQFHLMGRHWPHVDAPRHMALIPAAAMTALGAKHGLELEHCTSDDSDARSWNRFGWQRLLMNRFRSKTMQRVMFVAGYGISLVMAPFDRRPMKGSAYTMVLRKSAS